jgi:nucleotide-binding universal stress UspA family protein
MFQRILVPVDLTEKSQHAVDVALELASQSRAKVDLLHVIETVEHIEFEDMRSLYKRLEDSARKGLKEFSQPFVEQGLNIACDVTYGHRTRGIIEFAINNSVDLIVMASHRIDPDRPGHDWSTISYGVAVLAPCSVLLVKFTG